MKPFLILVALFATGFGALPLLAEGDLEKALVFGVVGALAGGLAYYRHQQERKKRWLGLSESYYKHRQEQEKREREGREERERLQREEGEERERQESWDSLVKQGDEAFEGKDYKGAVKCYKEAGKINRPFELSEILRGKIAEAEKEGQEERGRQQEKEAKESGHREFETGEISFGRKIPRIKKTTPPPPAHEKAKQNEQLIEVAGIGDIEAIRALLNAGVDVNATDNNGETALIWAVLWGHTEAIRELVESGADVNATDKNGWTAFDLWREFHQNRPAFQGISNLLRPTR